ncbi:putative disease resistance protein RGA1 [Selaginella moellendorffii]|uniref:putative disease resistance protein RGA1 n=1 Tax=Selaginella moellendorffii TaxID=88036 RepID=UPI000D1CBBC4|nr:putative disease resistance protein RGA1 [Selaginella moellendorffii]|eukprot:XP_024544300.1 putative disease resistance protein RGA1 [Selaginella moellendorffii]
MASFLPPSTLTSRNVLAPVIVFLILTISGIGLLQRMTDDVWDWSWAKELDFIARPSSGRILVTTRKEGILCSLDAKAFPVHELSMDESKKMFWKFAFGVHDPQPSDPDVVRFAEEIAQKCEGLPLALEVIGSAMAVHRSEGPHVWEERYKRLHLSNDPDVEKQMFKRLKFSYDELGNYEGEKLQECFLYVAAFPEDKKIEFSELRKCWMEVGSELSPTPIVNELERRWKYGPQQEHEKGCLFGYDWTIGIQDATFAKVSFISKNVSSYLSDNHVRDVLLLDKCEGVSNVDDSLIKRIEGVKFNIALLPQLSNLEELELDVDPNEDSSVVDWTRISRKLRHLNLEMRQGPMKVPESMGTLEHIETLYLCAKSIDFASVVGRWQLINLTPCEICVEYISRAPLKRMFKNSIRLQQFYIDGVEDSENSDDSFKWLPHHLETLDIDCGAPQSPRESENNGLHKETVVANREVITQRLRFWCTKMQNDFFEPSDQMTDIEDVRFDETIVPLSIASLPGLKRLTIYGRSVIQNEALWFHTQSQGALPRLESLICPEGMKIPPWLEDRPNLKI